VQDKAPIRSQATGPATLGERSDQTDRSTQRHRANPSTGQVWQAFNAHHRLSVPAVALAAHAANKVVFDQQGLILVAGILTAPVRVHDQSRRRAALLDRHAQGITDQACRHARGHRPAHDLA
jgi:hypothetical protein